jgi:hypothetical protein
MPSCATADALCVRVQRQEPELPLRTVLHASDRNACPLNESLECFPFVHVMGAYHSFMEEALGSGKGAHGAQHDARTLLSGRPDVDMTHRCLNNLDAQTFDSAGGTAFLKGWRTSRGAGKLLIAECMTGMMWYPNLAGRYSAAWSKSYWPCKASAIKAHSAKEFYRRLMWAKCRPEALAAHDEAHGSGGPGHETTPPVMLRALYPLGEQRAAVVAVLRNPTDRFETSFWLHPHYVKVYGGTADGLAKYAAEHVEIFRGCEASYGTRRCAFLFENLDKAFKKAFFACDQVIRGVYWPFIADWHAAFGSRLLVLTAEELLNQPQTARPRLLSFLGLPALSEGAGGGTKGSGGGGRPSDATPPDYAAMHAASLRSYGAQPMRNDTRALLDGFYAPHTRRLARILGWDASRLWIESVRLTPQDYARAAGVKYSRYGPYSSHPTEYGATDDPKRHGGVEGRGDGAHESHDQHGPGYKYYGSHSEQQQQSQRGSSRKATSSLRRAQRVGRARGGRLR